MADSHIESEAATENRAELERDLAAHNCTIHKADDPPLFTREPQSAMRPLHWRAEDLSSLLQRVGKEVAMKPGGNRRTVRLTNPALPYGTTPTFWGSIQYILPGEVATAHRHAASALRFVMQGNGAFTTVDSERYAMNKGDLVLTPAWTWHDHEHRGDEPMIWLDVLDISLVRSLQATFFEPFEKPVQDVSRQPQRSFQLFGSGIMRPAATDGAGPNPLLAYPADRAMAALANASELDPDPHVDTLLEYQNPVSGGPAMATLGTQLQMLRPGFQTLPRRTTGSSLTYVVRGNGASQIGDLRFDWSAGDFFVTPPWAWHHHRNDGAESAVFFTVSDSVTLKALGFYREQRQPAPGAGDAS